MYLMLLMLCLAAGCQPSKTQLDPARTDLSRVQQEVKPSRSVHNVYEVEVYPATHSAEGQ
jgi:hypothetical protein